MFEKFIRFLETLAEMLVDCEHYLEQLIMPIIYWHICSNRGGRIDGASNDQPAQENI